MTTFDCFHQPYPFDGMVLVSFSYPPIPPPCDLELFCYIVCFCCLWAPFPLRSFKIYSWTLLKYWYRCSFQTLMNVTRNNACWDYLLNKLKMWSCYHEYRIDRRANKDQFCKCYISFSLLWWRAMSSPLTHICKEAEVN